MKHGNTGKAGGAALVALALVLTPAFAATTQEKAKKAKAPSSIRAGSFTPAVSDPRLAAELARRGFSANSFRFTPASVTSSNSRAVRVAVRARAANPADSGRRAADASATAVTAITPTAYNLGVAVGWRHFALSGDVARIRGGALPGGREAAEVGVSYSGTKFTGRVEAGVDRADITPVRALTPDVGYTVGVGGSYRLTRNLDVTGGVRYRIQHDRLQPLADERRDSQAVYVGTAFRF
jgi:opacity protein-like surface antigen